jgi:alpha-D-xyloside xylohydrolase
MKNFTLKSRLVILVIALFWIGMDIHASVVSWKKVDDGVLCTLDMGLMKVKVCSENVIEVKYTTLPLFLDKQSLVVVNPWSTVPSFTVTENAGELTVATASVKIIVNKDKFGKIY